MSAILCENLSSVPVHVFFKKQLIHKESTRRLRLTRSSASGVYGNIRPGIVRELIGGAEPQLRH